MSDTAPFDPGIGNLAADLSTLINDIYQQLMEMPQLSRKRMYFRLMNSRIYNAMENNAAFYKGCLLWACCLKYSKKTEALIITGNPFLNLTREQLENYDYMIQVEFLENYFDAYERDTLYYTGRKIEIPLEWKKILRLYKEFLELNKGFINTKTSDDLVLPDYFSGKILNFDIKELIYSAATKKDLKILLEPEI